MEFGFKFTIVRFIVFFVYVWVRWIFFLRIFSFMEGRGEGGVGRSNFLFLVFLSVYFFRRFLFYFFYENVFFML